jgi:hypothetical protein
MRRRHLRSIGNDGLRISPIGFCRTVTKNQTKYVENHNSCKQCGTDLSLYLHDFLQWR